MKNYFIIAAIILVILYLLKRFKMTDETQPITTSGEPDKDKFLKVTGEVINRLEGGYFHPDMRTKNPDKFGAYHRSGETMYGLDRHAGHGLFYNEKRLSDDVIENMKNIYGGRYTYKTPEARMTGLSLSGAQNRMQSFKGRGLVDVVKVKAANGKISNYYGAK